MSAFVGLMLFCAAFCFLLGCFGLYFMYYSHTKHDDENMVVVGLICTIILFILCGISMSQVVHNIDGSPLKEEKRR